MFIKLLNKFGKGGKMQGLPNILLLFQNDVNKSNNTGARLLDSIYHRCFNDFVIAFFM